ncbi:DUF6989 domain-containing protein [Algiphilus sp.]|uniref:DUF6989 domain-containing protein n=1 Tax=Algiphilus sp. TaxID=1872431 RepID=UPI003B5259B0
MISLRSILVFHALFALLAFGAVLLAPAAVYGWVLLAAVLGYHVASLAWAAGRGDREWLRLWFYLLPLSMAQVVPDWILSEWVGSLVFHDHGIPRIGAVPVYMAGMWSIPLFLTVALARQARLPALRAVLAVVLALLLFASSEWYAHPLALWHAVGVEHSVWGVALYVLPPEAALGLAAWWGFETTRGRGIVPQLLVALATSVLYTGMLITSYFLIEYGATL